MVAPVHSLKIHRSIRAQATMRIFISHGTDKADAAELAFLDALYAELSAMAEHEILLDRTRIQAGDRWEGVLHDVLAGCQAAIVLLGKRALTRPWVFKECSVLAFRKARDDQFPLFTALLSGVTHDKLSKPLACLNLGAIQSFAPGATAVEVAAALKARLAAIAPDRDTPFDALVRALTTQIKEGDAPELEALCAELGEKVLWTEDMVRAKTGARVIAKAIVLDRLGSVGSLTALVKRLRNAGVDSNACARVVDLAAPRWVSPAAASRLGMHVEDVRRPAGPAPAHLAAALNADLADYSPLMHTWRARVVDPTHDVYSIEGGGSTDWHAEIFNRIFDAYRGANPKTVRTRAAAETALKALKEPVFFVLPPPVPDRELLLTLRDRLPHVVFLAHSGSEPLASELLPEGVFALEPAVDPSIEADNYSDYVAAHNASSS